MKLISQKGRMSVAAIGFATATFAAQTPAYAGPEVVGKLTARNAADFCHAIEIAEPKTARFAFEIEIGDNGRRSVSYQFDTTKKQLTLWLKGDAFHEDCDIIIRGLRFGKEYFSSEDSPDHWIRVDVDAVRTKMLKGFFELEFKASKIKNVKSETIVL